MPGTYSRILFHIVFSTKNRANLIKPDVQSRLYEYIGGIVRGERGVLYAAGGIPDHVHLLVSWRTDESVADLMRKLKSHSSKWVKQEFPLMGDFAWQEGYGAFSVSQSKFDAVKAYIADQAHHHRQRTFQQEFVELLDSHRIEYDERYLWN